MYFFPFSVVPCNVDSTISPSSARRISFYICNHFGSICWFIQSQYIVCWDLLSAYFQCNHLVIRIMQKTLDSFPYTKKKWNIFIDKLSAWWNINSTTRFVCYPFWFGVCIASMDYGKIEFWTFICTANKKLRSRYINECD